MKDGSGEVVGTFHDVEALEHAADMLMSNGFDRSALSLIATEDAVRKKFGARLVNGENLDDHTIKQPIAYMNDDDDAIGRGVLIRGAGGASIETLLGSWLDAETASAVSDNIERGGLILWVRTQTPNEDDQASGVMIANDARGVHTYVRKDMASPKPNGRSRLGFDQVGEEGNDIVELWINETKP